MLLLILVVDLTDIIFWCSIDGFDQRVLNQKSVVIANIMGEVGSVGLPSFDLDVSLGEGKDIAYWRLYDEERGSCGFDLDVS